MTLAAEARVNSQPSGTHVRPAAFAYTELPPAELPLGLRAEFYGQAGYVGGNFASAFADGQLRLDRRFVRLGRGELRVGGGIWGGAQRDASRLDVGPAATLGLPLGARGGARLSADWRFRVAGRGRAGFGAGRDAVRRFLNSRLLACRPRVSEKGREWTSIFRSPTFRSTA